MVPGGQTPPQPTTDTGRAPAAAAAAGAASVEPVRATSTPELPHHPAEPEPGLATAARGQIFLSYGRSSRVTPFARWCKAQLEAAKWNVWMDEVRVVLGS